MELLRSDPVFIAAQIALVGKIALTVFVFDPIAADTFALVKSTSAHAASLLLLALLAALAIRHGTLLLTRSPIHLAAIALVAVLLIATPFAIDQTVGAFGISRRFLGATQVLDNFVIYFAAVAVLPTFSDLRRIAWGLLAVVVPVLLYALVQRSGHDPVHFEVTGERPFSTLGQQDTLAGFLSIWVGSLLAIVGLGWPVIGRPRSGVLFAIAAVALVVIVFTGVRNAYLGILAAAVVAAAIWLVRSGRPRSGAVALVALGAGLLLAPIALYVASGLGFGFAREASLQSRLLTWEAATRLIADRPLLGLGPDNFGVAYRGVRTLDAAILSGGETFDSTHNWFFYFATSAGLLGSGAVTALIVTVGIAGLRLVRAGSPFALALIPFAAYLGQGLADTSDIAIDWVFWLSAGAIAAAATRGAWSLPTPARARRWSVVPALMLVVVAILAARPFFDRIEASEVFKTSLLFAQEGNGPQAVEASRIAIFLDPRRSDYWNAFGGALAVSGNARAAATAFADAAARAPWDPGYPKNIALQKVRYGDFSGAESAIQHALALDPYDADSLDIEARFTFNRGELERAASLGEIAVKVRPYDVSKYEVPVRAYLQLKRFADAERLLSDGLKVVDDAHLHVLMALTYFSEGRRDASLSELDRALALQPGDEEAVSLRDQILAAR